MSFNASFQLGLCCCILFILNAFAFHSILILFVFSQKEALVLYQQFDTVTLHAKIKA